MASLFATGHAVDVVLAVIGLEAIILKLRGWSLRGQASLGFVRFDGILLIALPLMLSLPVHLADVAQRKARKP